MAKGCSSVHKHKETCGNGQKGNLWQLSTKDVQEIPKIQKIQNPKVEFGHIVSENHQTVYLTWRKSFCGIFMSVSLQAAIHLRRDFSLNLRSVKNQSSKSVEQLFRTTEKMIKEQTERTRLSTIN